MRITQWGEYGIHFSICLARAEREGTPMLGAAEIARLQCVDLQYAQQILQRLRRGSIVESVRGPLGGYQLSRPAAQITLRDILLAAEGDTFEIICEAKPINAERCAGDALCSLRPIWHELKEHVNAFFEKYTLDMLVDMPETVFGKKADAPVQIGGVIQRSESEA